MRFGARFGWTIVAAGLAGGCSTTGPLEPSKVALDYAREGAWGSQRFALTAEKLLQIVPDAMADLQMRAGRSSRGMDDTLIVDGQVQDGRHARVVIHRLETESVVSVRVGRFGDDALARALLERIGVRVGSLPPSAIPAEPPEPAPNPSILSRIRTFDPLVQGTRGNDSYTDSPVP